MDFIAILGCMNIQLCDLLSCCVFPLEPLVCISISFHKITQLQWHFANRNKSIVLCFYVQQILCFLQYILFSFFLTISCFTSLCNTFRKCYYQIKFTISKQLTKNIVQTLIFQLYLSAVGNISNRVLLSLFLFYCDYVIHAVILGL